MPHKVTKRYGHDLGLSACFRQHRADSHCKYLHGYALSFEFEFEANTLDERGWVVDFGALKPLKDKLVDMFDHKLLIAADDPHMDSLSELQGLGLVDAVVLPRGVGCERFAELAFSMANVALVEAGLKPRVQVVSVKCAEHGANSATYFKDYV